MITSPQNERVKHLARLGKDGRLRREHGHFLVEGPRFVETALAGEARVEELIYSPNIAGKDHPLVARAEARGVAVLPVSKDCYRKIADVRSPQGLAALVSFPEHELAEVLSRPDGLYLAACGVQDPGNLGTMIRSADAAGAAGVLVVRPAADIYNSKVVRSTAGSLLNLPVISLEEAGALEALSSAGVRLVLAEAGAGDDVRAADWSRPLALAVGSEADGFSPAVREVASSAVRVPMWGTAESLNAAAAAAVCLYAARWSDRE
ncbi:MAG: TrmH family RNA methyltransferase [Planctomycetota bacterium]|jgi:TrmH family RNA methyltransferase